MNLEDGQYLDVQRCMGLLAFPLDTEVGPYKVQVDEAVFAGLLSVGSTDGCFRVMLCNIQMAYCVVCIQPSLLPRSCIIKICCLIACDIHVDG